MNLNSLITAPARLGLALGGRVLGGLRSRFGGAKQIDDDTLKGQVEADVFASRRVSSEKLQVEVAEGVVWLRGEAPSGAIADEIEARAGAIAGVKRVENLIRVAKAEPTSGSQKRPAPKRSARPQPAAATAPPPAVEPAPATPPSPPAEEERTAPRRFVAEDVGEGGSPPAPFPTVANGPAGDERSG